MGESVDFGCSVLNVGIDSWYRRFADNLSPHTTARYLLKENQACLLRLN